MADNANFDVPMIENSVEHSVCEILDFPDAYRIIEAVTVVDFLQGAMEIVYKHCKDNKSLYYSVLTDSLVLMFTSTEQNSIGE